MVQRTRRPAGRPARNLFPPEESLPSESNNQNQDPPKQNNNPRNPRNVYESTNNQDPQPLTGGRRIRKTRKQKKARKN